MLGENDGDRPVRFELTDCHPFMVSRRKENNQGVVKVWKRHPFILRFRYSRSGDSTSSSGVSALKKAANLHKNTCLY